MIMKKSVDERFMNLALRLARLGAGRVSPNPMVGAVLVKSGEVVATGFHKGFGQAHAEVEALKKVGFQANDMVLYVNLEPCCHYGNTPPCTDAIIRAGVRRVVVGTVDRNPIVSGRGIERLREAGVEVTVGVLEAQGVKLNEGFFKWITTGFPFVTLKLAITLDGKIADREMASRWVSGEKSRQIVHRIRAVSDCVMVGAGTFEADNPTLLPAIGGIRGRIPLRMVVSSYGDIAVSEETNLLRTKDRGKVVIACGEGARKERVEALQRLGFEVSLIKEKDGHVDVKELFKSMGSKGLVYVLVEGGAKLAASVLREDLVDRLILFIAPKLLGDPEAVPMVTDLGIRALSDSKGFCVERVRKVGQDVMVTLTRGG
jgi:diaminohydroxyphosphoribosylaminopyrimidine deaminase/5-amino-6-(5-phosphoribosylamino)uracil reductase